MTDIEQPKVMCMLIGGIDVTPFFSSFTPPRWEQGEITRDGVLLLHKWQYDRGGVFWAEYRYVGTVRGHV